MLYFSESGDSHGLVTLREWMETDYSPVNAVIYPKQNATVMKPSFWLTIYMYTVNHKKRWQYICDHNFGKSRSIFIIFALL